MAQEIFLDPPMPDIIEQWKFYLEQLDLQPGDKVLDVGCNRGETEFFLVNLYPYIGKVTGIDINPEAIGRANQVLAEEYSSQKITFEQGDALDLKHENNTFDKIICLETLEWISEPLTAVKEIYRVLKPGGTALIGHTDFESQLFATKNLTRTRKIKDKFCDLGPDGIIGRKLNGICKQVDFSEVETEVYTLTNEQFAPNYYSYRVAHMMKEWLSGKEVVAGEELTEWLGELKELSEAGEFFYSINRYLSICCK